MSSAQADEQTAREIPDVATELTRARARTLGLVDILSDDEQCEQVSPLMSPAVWDLAHVGNYEELWLLRELDGRAPIDPVLDDLYNAIEHPRWERPTLPLLGPVEARAYNARVRTEVLELLTDAASSPGSGRADDQRVTRLLQDDFVYGMVIQHEHQHCETLLATHQLRGERALVPPGADHEPASPVVTTSAASTPDSASVCSSLTTGSVEVFVDGGTSLMGTSQHRWAYDNERSVHEIVLEPFFIDSLPVTNRDFMEFISDGGYRDERLWTPEGWEWRIEADAESPAFWSCHGAGSYSLLRFGRHIDLTDASDEAVQHVSWHEADTFARWAGKRLPTEPEWEKAATWDPLLGAKHPYPWGDEPPDAMNTNLGQRRTGPVAAGAHPEGASPYGCLGMIGDVWEWTSSDFNPYPGFEPFPYHEYSAVFWGDRYKVLRGGSWATDPVAVRGTFRNWDFPIRRQIFSGFRCARDA